MVAGSTSEGDARSEALARAHAEREDRVGYDRLLGLLLAYWAVIGVFDVVGATYGTANPQLAGYLGFRVGGWVVLAVIWAVGRRLPADRIGALSDAVGLVSGTSALGLAAFGAAAGDRYPTVAFMTLPMIRAFLPAPIRQGFVRGVVTGGGVAVAFTVLCVLIPGVRSAALAEAPRMGTILAMFTLGAVPGSWIGGYLWTVREQLYATSGFGRYQLRRRLGSGGMGEVWVAWHATMAREVAVKLLRPLVAAGSVQSAGDAQRRFDREIHATAALSHPNTVRIFDHGITDDGLPYYTMELLDGATIGELVRRDGPMPPARVMRIGRQAARALAEAHRKGIVHRDVKPDNLFVADAGGEPDFVKVLDFGIARFGENEPATGTETGDSTPAAPITVAGKVTGTPSYMPPETAAGRPADPRSDVYSLGATLYFALTGSPPITAAKARHVLDGHRAGFAAPSERLGRPLPRELEAVVLRCLARDPADRYPDADAVVAAIDACEPGNEAPVGRATTILEDVHAAVTSVGTAEDDSSAE
jgi:hypothetical protein